MTDERAEVLTVTIQHGEDDLREWRGHGGEPVTIDRRAVDRIEREAAACRAVCAPRAVEAWVPSGGPVAPGCECAP